MWRPARRSSRQRALTAGSSPTSYDAVRSGSRAERTNVQIGIHLPQYGRAAGPDAITRAARAAESLGFADVWVSDHVAQPASQGYPSPYLFDPLLTLGWAAAATERIGLGTSVLVAAQYHPLWLANAT